MANPFRNFIWMDRPATGDTPETFRPSRTGALSALGQAMSGFAAPFAGDYEYGLKLAKQNMERERADQEFQMYLMERQAGSAQQPVYIANPLTGELINAGSVPKGSKVVTQPLESPGQKQQRELDTASSKEQMLRDNKLKGLYDLVDFFESEINKVPGGQGLGGRVKGAGVALSGMAQTDPDVAAYMTTADGLSAQIARGLGDVGNLSAFEQQKAIRLLPTVTDNIETRKSKIEKFRKYLDMKVGGGKSRSDSGEKAGTQTFTIGGKTYNIPADKVADFKKAKGIK